MKTPRSRITLALLTGLLSLAAVQALLVAIAGHPAAVHAGAPAPSPAAAGPAANAVVLDVRIAPGSNSPAQGQTVTYTLVVSNTGDTTASGAVLSNTLPAGLDYVTATLQATAGSPAYLTTERTIRWDGDLAANSPVTLTYAAVLTTGDFVYNTAVITHPQAFQAAGATSSPVDEWSEPELVDTAPRFGATLGSWRHLAVDSHDVPHVAYAGNALYYATYTGTRWITETVPVTRSRDTTSLGAAALTLDDQGRALIAFYGEDALWLARQVAAPGSSSTSLQPEGSGQALTWTVEHIADVPNSAADYKLDLKRGSDGRLHLVYNYDRELYYTVHNGTAWLTPTVAITQTACSLSPYSSNYGFSLALDQNDVPYVACVQDNAPPYEVRLYTHSAAAPWTTYEVITSSNRYYAYPSLVYDGATPHLAFFQGNTALYHAQRGSGWQTTWVDSVGSGHLQQNAALEIRGGQVAIAYAWYLYTDPDSTSILRLAARPLTDSTWLTETVESFAAGWNRPRPSLALDGAGRAHLAYYYAPDETLRHAAQTGSFTIHTVEESRPIGKSAVAVGSDARIHLAYLSRGLRYATRGPDTLTWTKQLAVPGVDDAWTTELALALDAANVPHVAYREPGQPLYHATLNNTTWVTRSVDPGANLVSAPSIGAEVTNTAHIAYLAIQGSNRVVRHAAFDGSVWTAETLATAGPDTSDHRQSPRLVAQNNQAYVLYADCTAYQAGGTYPINLVLATLDAGSWNTRTLYNFSGTCNGNLNYRLLGDGAGRLAAVAEVWGGSGQPGWQTSTFWIEGGQVTSQTTSQAGGAVSPTGLAPLGGPTPTGQVGIRGDGLEIVTTRNGQKYVQYVDRQGYRSEGTTVGTTRDSWTDLYGLDRQDSTGVVVEQSGAQKHAGRGAKPPPRKPPGSPRPMPPRPPRLRARRACTPRSGSPTPSP
ncbi:MAG: DUF11 domain-containing protein [Ardenticatenaceae bacterium]|nr:DUF11 domain-containing protein [Ardenticatenaceae bacterium]